MTGSKPERGSIRVKAWIWGAINPLLDELERVLEFLDTGNLTWRYRSGRPEFVHPAHEYLDRNGRLNLEDLVRYPNSELAPKLEENTVKYAAAVSRATQFHSFLVGSNSFLLEVEAVREHYEVAHPGKRFEALFAAEDPPQLIAERIVNHLERLPDYYGDAPLWNSESFRASFRAFENAPESKPLREAVSALGENVRQLAMHLNTLRTMLCDDFDVSPAPFAGA
jgi:hypothetical protein